MRILIAEDQPELRRMLVKNLTAVGYTVDGVPDGAEALAYLDAAAYDAAVLDIMMPRVDGLTVLRTLRARGSALPVLLLTARDAVADRVDGLDAGADDYLIKPFALDELLARLRVLTRKKGSGSTNVYTLADLTVDTAARTAKRGDRTLELSAREYALLEYLIRSKGVVLSRQQIEDNLWSLDYAGGTNVVDVYISYLRKKLDGGHEKKLLHITRLEQGTQKLQLETADLSQLVEVLCEEQAHLAPEGTTLAVHTQPDLLVNGDVTLLSRLLTNLISNAYRYGKPNGHVWVDLRREGQWAVLSVRDDGSGIAP